MSDACYVESKIVIEETLHIDETVQCSCLRPVWKSLLLTHPNQNQPKMKQGDDENDVAQQYVAVKESLEIISRLSEDRLDPAPPNETEKLPLKERILKFYEEESLLIEVSLGIILARLYPILGAKYLVPEITAHWIAVIFIFCTCLPMLLWLSTLFLSHSKVVHGFCSHLLCSREGSVKLDENSIGVKGLLSCFFPQHTIAHS